MKFNATLLDRVQENLELDLLFTEQQLNETKPIQIIEELQFDLVPLTNETFFLQSTGLNQTLDESFQNDFNSTLIDSFNEKNNLGKTQIDYDYTLIDEKNEDLPLNVQEEIPKSSFQPQVFTISKIFCD